MPPTVRLGKRTVAKPKKTAQGDVSDGFSWKLHVVGIPKNKPYTIFQTIDRTVHYRMGKKSKTDRARFTEIWQKPKAGVEIDSFRVPRWWRTPDTGKSVVGYLDVKAKIWAVQGKVSYKSVGAKKGSEGSSPWGDAYGMKRVLQPPPDHPYLIRRFKLHWNNPKIKPGVDKPKVTVDDLQNGKDMSIIMNNEQSVDPTAVESDTSEELHM